jgi:hypothetical protein
MTSDQLLGATELVATDMASVTASIAPAVLIIGGISTAFTILMCWYASSATKGPIVDQSKLMTQSVAFWARWPGDRLFAAPYAELSSEATRCAQIIALLQGRRGPDAQKVRDRRRDRRAYFDGQIATYQGMLAAVQNAMNYVASQGRGPHAPPYRA